VIKASGLAIDRSGLGALVTPGIGRSLALEKVAQFGPQDSIAESMHSWFRRSLFRIAQKRSAPLRWSQGSATPGSLSPVVGAGGSSLARTLGVGPSSLDPGLFEALGVGLPSSGSRPREQTTGIEGTCNALRVGVAWPGSWGGPSKGAYIFSPTLWYAVFALPLGAAHVEALGTSGGLGVSTLA
jgi:hypothetical protein